MTPYYVDGRVQVWHGDCREILPSLNLPPARTLVITDPPYGIDWDADYSGRGLSQNTGARDRSYEPVAGDGEPFDPAWLLSSFKRLVLFGANNYASRLPDSAGWVVWDKTGAGRVAGGDFSDAELAWTNITGGVRSFSHLWKGMCQDSEKGTTRFHPTQKPAALFRWLITRFAKPGDVILDPYMGSGSTLHAAIECGYPAVGVELSEHYCRLASERLANLSQLSLFGGAA